MNAGTHDEPVTAHDVRTAQFTLVKRGGYDTQEVDAFLDQVAETLDHVAELEYRTPARPPVEAPPRPEADRRPEPVAPQLHDPDGAAQRLLAAAQRTSDTLTAEARTYASQVRGDADAYAQTTRTEADDHAARVTSAAESQAAAIRAAAAEEARRVAEDTRASLVSEIERLQVDRDRLMGDTDRIRRIFEVDRERMLTIVDTLRREIADAGIDGGGAGDTTVATADRARGDDLGDGRYDQAIVAGEPADQGGPAVALGNEPDEQLGAEEAEALAVDEPHDVHRAPSDTDTAAPDADHEEAAAGDAADTVGSASIFDIEADDEWEDTGPPTEAMPVVDERGAGDQFFDELRAAEEDGLGPLDEDTDAAMTAFFEGDGDDDESWRRRFGGRG